MKKFESITLALIFLALSGCSSEEPTESTEAPPPVESKFEPLFNDQRQALEKAKGVEKMIMDTDEKRRKMMEEQGL